MGEFLGENQMEIDRIATGKNIKRMVRERNLHVDDVSEALGISSQAIYKWYRGESLPELERFCCLAQVLSTTIDELIVLKKV